MYNESMIQCVIWRHVHDKNTHKTTSTHWSELTQPEGLLGKYSTLTQPANCYLCRQQPPVVQVKFSGRLFGPYTLKLFAPDDKEPKRRNERIAATTLAVFDADVGKPQACRDLLSKAGLAQHWYTSFSHTQDKDAWRLVLPVQRPILTHEWKMFRERFIHMYQVPLKEDACKGVSHPFFLPACPLGGSPETLTLPGEPIDVDEVLRGLVLRPEPERKKYAVELPEDPTNPVDLRPLLELLKKRKTSLLRSKSAYQREKGQLLGCVLEHKSIGVQGNRHDNIRTVCGVVVFTCKNQALSTYRALVLPSIAATPDPDPYWTDRAEADMEKAIIGSMQRWAEQQAEQKEWEENMEKQAMRVS